MSDQVFIKDIIHLFEDVQRHLPVASGKSYAERDLRRLFQAIQEIKYAVDLYEKGNYAEVGDMKAFVKDMEEGNDTPSHRDFNVDQKEYATRVEDYNKSLSEGIAQADEKAINGLVDEMFQGHEFDDNHRSMNVGESDYASRPIQPWDVWLNWALNPWDADIVKRTVRVKAVPDLTPLDARIQDYEKIKHICDERIDQLKKGDPYYDNFRVPPWVTSDV